MDETRILGVDHGDARTGVGVSDPLGLTAQPREVIRGNDAAKVAERVAEIARRVYHEIPKISIDYGVMERAAKVAVVEADFSWDDVGSWTAYAAHLKRDPDGNDVEGEFISVDCRDCIVVSPPGKPVAAVGIEGVVVIDTPDTLLHLPALARPGREEDRGEAQGAGAGGAAVSRPSGQRGALDPPVRRGVSSDTG